MQYIHKSKFQSHGHLTSAACFVDSRWVLKIGGFGLNAFRREKDRDEVKKSRLFDESSALIPSLFVKAKNFTCEWPASDSSIIAGEKRYLRQAASIFSLSSEDTLGCAYRWLFVTWYGSAVAQCTVTWALSSSYLEGLNSNLQKPNLSAYNRQNWQEW